MPSPTHFLCLPLAAGPQLSRALASFRTDVTSAAGFGLPDEAVRPVGTLHLTLGVMSLKQDDLDRAIEVLRRLNPQEMLAEVRSSMPRRDAASDGSAVMSQQSQHGTDTAPVAVPSGSRTGTTRAHHASGPPSSKTTGLSITLRGLQAMHDASKASVLYAPPSEPDGILRSFCQKLRKPFMDSGLMIDDGRPLLLHATIINTIYVKPSRVDGGRGGRGGRGGGGSRRERMTIDARDLLDRYRDYVWMEGFPITRVAICKMGAKKIEGTDDAAYEVVSEIVV